LEALNSPMINLLYQRMSVSPLTQEAIMGASGLIRIGQGTAISSAVALVPQLANYQIETNVLLFSIRSAFRATDPQSAAALGRAAADNTNPSLAFRQACAEALRAIHTLAALPYLATLLDDPDQSIQSSGAAGMAAFANGLPVQTLAGVPSLSFLQRPATAPYMTPNTIANGAAGPRAYTTVAFWKAWWAANGSALAAQPSPQ
jgi:hypothetical protein